jgi:hypothetical protein
MRTRLMILPILMCASPALAQQAPAAHLPRELTDPATAQKLAGAMQVLSNAFLNMKVGEVQAAIEGRQATPQEKNLTVRDMARREDPDFDHHFQQQMANVGPMMRQSMQALDQALPAMMQGLGQAQQALERAVANMPNPNYPKR